MLLKCSCVARTLFYECLDSPTPDQWEQLHLYNAGDSGKYASCVGITVKRAAPASLHSRASQTYCQILGPYGSFQCTQCIHWHPYHISWESGLLSSRTFQQTFPNGTAFEVNRCGDAGYVGSGSRCLSAAGAVHITPLASLKQTSGIIIV